MILDNTTMFADNLAHGGTPAVIDLQVAKINVGEPVRIMIAGSANLAGCTGVNILTGSTSSPATNIAAHTFNPAGQVVELILPPGTLRYVTLDLIGTTSAGTWTAGIVMAGTSLNQ